MKKDMLIALASIAFVGCSLASQSQTNKITPAPAIITTPNSESLIELQSAVTKLLGQTHVLLAKDVFSQTSLLTLERSAHKNANGQLIMGRVTELPWQLQLVKKADTCYIKETTSEKLFALKKSNCQLEQ